MRRAIFWSGVALFAVALAALSPLALVTGCSRQSGEPAIFTGKVYSADQVRTACGWAFLGKAQYAEINRDWLPWYYAQFRAEIAAGAYGVVKWEPNACCTFFASRFASGAQLHYFAQNWNTGLAANGIAVGKRWYTPAGGKDFKATEGVVTQIETPPEEPLLAELRAFLDSIKTRATPRADAQSGYAAVRVLNAALESVKTGKAVTL